MHLVGNVQVVAGNAATIDRITAALKEEGVQAIGNPDVYIRQYNGFGIDEARELGQKASMRAIASPRRIFIIVTPTMTADAQNALLKTLEEPAANALFFLVVPSPHLLLPTLRSRAQLLYLGTDATGGPVDVAQFLRATPQERIDLLKPLFDKDDDDKRDLGSSIAFLANLERAMSKDLVANRGALSAIYRARRYLGDKGSLHKALLEQVAVLI